MVGGDDNRSHHAPILLFFIKSLLFWHHSHSLTHIHSKWKGTLHDRHCHRLETESWRSVLPLPPLVVTLAKQELGWKGAALLERKVLRMWVGGKGRGERRGAEQRGRSDRARGWQAQAWACHWNVFLLWGRRSQRRGRRRRREGGKLQGKKEKMRAAAEIKRTGVSWKSNLKTLLAKQDTHTDTHTHRNWRLHLGYDRQDNMKGRFLLSRVALGCFKCFRVNWVTLLFLGETFQKSGSDKPEAQLTRCLCRNAQRSPPRSQQLSPLTGLLR